MATDAVRVTVTVARVLRAFLEDPGREQYGFDLMRRVRISSGALYPVLKRLEVAGWIEGHREVGDAGSGRPPRRYYLLTGEGQVLASAALAKLSTQVELPRSTNWLPALEGGVE